jgi:acetyltransferase-like isoleucine patch superfamily enzyme
MDDQQDSELARAFDMPWLVANGLKRVLALPYIRFGFALHGISWGRRWRIFGMPIIQRHRKSRIELGDGLYMRSWSRSNPLTPNHRTVLSTRRARAVITVGKDCGFTGATIVADQKVQIGDRVQVGANAVIVDTNFHPITPEGRRDNMHAGASAPVIIEDDVFIGMQSIILKGVTVGVGSVVGAGSVVARDVPSRSVVIGNPAQVVKKLT